VAPVRYATLSITAFAAARQPACRQVKLRT
jgi:hypothetical protein